MNCGQYSNTSNVFRFLIAFTVLSNHITSPFSFSRPSKQLSRPANIRFQILSDSYLRSKPSYYSSRDSSMHSVKVGEKMDANHDGMQRLSTEKQEQEVVPATLSEAVRVFFFGPYHGPLLVSFILASMSFYRAMILGPLTAIDAVVCFSMVVFWWFQEHFLHGTVLHSKFDWIGKTIHEGHHAKPYFHVSIDPAELLVGWLLVAHIVFRCVCPTLEIALSATLGYAFAGLFYEWAHFVAHTRVRFKSSFWRELKSHHLRHHQLDKRYWLAFSVKSIDSVFGTNPSIHEVRAERIRMRELAQTGNGKP